MSLQQAISDTLDGFSRPLNATYGGIGGGSFSVAVVTVSDIAIIFSIIACSFAIWSSYHTGADARESRRDRKGRLPKSDDCPEGYTKTFCDSRPDDCPCNQLESGPS